MVDSVFVGVYPSLKAIDNGDGTYSIAVSILGLPPLTGMTAGELLVATGATTVAWQNTGVILQAPDISGIVTAAAALTMPAFTMGGALAMGSNSITGLQALTVVANATITSTVDNSNIQIRGGTASAGSGAYVTLASKNAGASVFALATANVAGNADVTRMSVSGNLAIAVATWSNVTHTGIVLGGALDANAQQIDNIASMIGKANFTLTMEVDNSNIQIRGGTASAGSGAFVTLASKNAGASAFTLATANVAGNADVTRLAITGNLATAVATWTNVTHTGLELSGNLTGATRSILNISHSTLLASTGWGATTDAHWVYLQGGTFSNGGGAKLVLYGKDNASNGAAIIQTPDAAETANTTRMTFAGDADIARIQVEAGGVLNVGTAVHATPLEGDVRILAAKLNVYLGGAWEVVTSV